MPAKLHPSSPRPVITASQIGDHAYDLSGTSYSVYARLVAMGHLLSSQNTDAPPNDAGACQWGIGMILDDIAAEARQIAVAFGAVGEGE